MEQFLSILFTIVSFLVALSIVVFVHEWGHLAIARRNGVRCESFSIGFGHEIWGRTDRFGTRWKVCWLPLGGYVKMFGEAETMAMVEGGHETGAEPAKPRPLTPEERAVSFKYKTAGQRAAVVFAGPAVNILFAVAVFWMTFVVSGRSVTEPVIGAVLPDSAAAEAGLLAGDRIASIDGETIARFEDIQRIIAIAHGQPMSFVIERDGQSIELQATPRIVEDEDAFGNAVKHALLGISVSREARRMEHGGVVQSLGWAIEQCYVVMEGTFVAVGQMLRGTRGTEDLGGPIRIAKYSGQAAKSGPFNFVIFVAILSLNLGMINLLPVPLLDGGHLLFYAIEAARGRPLSETVQEWGLRVGLALVLALMVFVTWNDIVQF
ncbi:MAG: RIP metalloprotease RseP [Alphaproteobacteria bacterium]|nr:RIP metalloprotease RseP [Alphaproteobacteria bacterium]